MTKKEYDHARYVANREAVIERSIAYGKTERGRAVNSTATKKYGSTEKGVQRRVGFYNRQKENPEAYAEYLRKHRANNAVVYALKVGKLVKGVCEKCGNADTQAHHDDYENKLDVRWLCAVHHGLTRRKTA